MVPIFSVTFPRVSALRWMQSRLFKTVPIFVPCIWTVFPVLHPLFCLVFFPGFFLFSPFFPRVLFLTKVKTQETLRKIEMLKRFNHKTRFQKKMCTHHVRIHVVWVLGCFDFLVWMIAENEDV